MVITLCARPHVPGVATVTWTDRDERQDRCVLARVALADPRWLQVADVVVCPPQRSREAAQRRAVDTLRELPGCLIAAAAWPGRCSVLVREVGAFTFCAACRADAGLFVEVCAVSCYVSFVSLGRPAVSSWASRSRRSCTCRARGS